VATQNGDVVRGYLVALEKRGRQALERVVSNDVVAHAGRAQRHAKR
jgi:hypothetical protein